MNLFLNLDETGSGWKSDYIFEAISTVNVIKVIEEEVNYLNYVLPVTLPNIIIDTMI